MKTIAFHNLGCKVNSYEIEVMQQKFEKSGYLVVPFDRKADIYVVNTCTVTNIADRKSRQMLHKAKKNNPNAIVVATGCYVQTDTEGAIADDSIDVIIGNNRKADIVDIVERYMNDNGSDVNVIDINDTNVYEEMMLEHTVEHSRAYIKIQDGCNQFCTYCAIPYARGRVRSRHKESIIEEISNLVREGYKEFVFTGIHISSYGMDFVKNNPGDYLEEGKDLRTITYEKGFLLDLIKTVVNINGVERLRLGSLEPRIITEEFVSEISKLKQVCPHFHLSMQSGCDDTLKRMNRHYTSDEFYEKVLILRKYYAKPAITTDIITGFPGETEEEFNITEEFVKKVNFFETHIFKYSPRKGTVAAKMNGQNSDGVKSERSDRLEKIDKQNRLAFINNKIGKRLSIIIEEEKIISEKKYLVGHSEEYIMCAVDTNAGRAGEIVTGIGSKMIADDVLYIS